MKHIPVLYKEVLEGLNIKVDGLYVDATVGMGGHAKGIVENLTTGHFIGIDKDTYALNESKKNLLPFGNKVKLIHGDFINLKKVLKEENINKVDGILMDIGVSSPQLDNAYRGFSYMQDGPLDMRMDSYSGRTAADIIAEASPEELEEIFWSYGEERWGRRIAQRIVREREDGPIKTTLQLADLVSNAIPKRNQDKGHPARRVFQALRIEVNQELKALESALKDAVDLLNPGGRICVITFHSLEDRIVKKFFVEENRDCICPPQIPICACDKEKRLKIITRRPLIASELETKENPRAKSAKLRIAEKV